MVVFYTKEYLCGHESFVQAKKGEQVMLMLDQNHDDDGSDECCCSSAGKGVKIRSIVVAGRTLTSLSLGTHRPSYTIWTPGE